MKNSSNMLVLGLVCLSFVAGPHLVRAHFQATSGDEDSLQKTIVEQERKELDCLKTGNMELFSTLIANDAVFVNARGTAGKAEVVKNTSIGAAGRIHNGRCALCACLGRERGDCVQAYGKRKRARQAVYGPGLRLRVVGEARREVGILIQPGDCSKIGCRRAVLA